MESQDSYWSDLAALAWQVELGADEATLESPIDRYTLDVKSTAPAPPAVAEARTSPPPVPQVHDVDAVAVAQAAADAAADLPALARAMEAFELCDLKKGARSFAFADGLPGARVMIVGEAPGREEDQQGKPFVGQAGQLLNRMFAAIGLARDAEDAAQALYITNVLPWRPPGNRAPEVAEIAMMLPFLHRHIALANPDLVVLMGNTPCQAVLQKTGITRLRGHWTEALGRPMMPMLHPAYLLRQPAAKREAWADLLEIQARLNT
jgi:DNA polymerase